MKIHRTADDFLQDIVDWGERAARHTASLTREQFMSDEKSQDAVSKCISNVGEAANKVLKLDPTIMERFPEFEAEKAYAARNVISHDYFALDAAVLWATVKQAVRRPERLSVVCSRASHSAPAVLVGTLPRRLMENQNLSRPLL